MDRIGFAAVKQPKGKGWQVVVVNDRGLLVGTLGGNRAARAAAAVVCCGVDDAGVTRSHVEGLRQDIASARSYARQLAPWSPASTVFVVVPVLSHDEWYGLGQASGRPADYVYVGGES